MENFGGNVLKAIFISAASLLLGYSSIYTAVAQADDEPTAEQDWATTSLSMEFVAQQLTPAECYQSDRTFIGCIDAIDSIVGAQTPPMELAWNGQSVVVQARPAAPSREGQSLADFLRAERARKDQELQTWSQAFRRTSRSQINTSQLILSEGAKVATVKRPMVAGLAMNTFFVSALDPHTYFTPMVSSQRAMSSSSESFVGIGAIVEKVGELVIVQRVVPGGAAAAGGVQDGDIIVSVDGTPVGANEALDAVVSRIRGPAGSQVIVQFRRDGNLIDKTMTRSRVTLQNISSRLVSDSVQGGDYIYIRIESFMSSSTCEDFEAAYNSHASARAKGLIVDVRANGGGSVDEVVCIASLLLQQNGVVISVQDPATNRDTGERYNTIPTRTEISLPLIVLTDAGSASASEILAGVIQDYNRGLIVGERTFGKGTIQSVGPLVAVPGVHMARTIGRFHLPSGRSNQLVGVVPDIEGFRNPTPTADDQVRMREEDLYRFPIRSAAQPHRPSSEAQSVTTCLRGQTRAASEFGRTGIANNRDFQLLLARDAMECMIP